VRARGDVGALEREMPFPLDVSYQGPRFGSDPESSLTCVIGIGKKRMTGAPEVFCRAPANKSEIMRGKIT
jgi:hypothetical protein